MIKTFQGHFQDGRFISSQTATIPENVEVLIIVTDSPISITNTHKKAMKEIRQHRRTAKNPRLLREPDTTKPSLLGCMDGLVKIPDDFHEPLEEMKEYMY